MAYRSDHQHLGGSARWGNKSQAPICGFFLWNQCRRKTLIRAVDGGLVSHAGTDKVLDLSSSIWDVTVRKNPSWLQKEWWTIELNWFEKLFTLEVFLLSLELDDHCRFDFIALYDGPSTTSGLLQQLCGRGQPTFESSSNSMTVVLSTDYANSYRGFSASYTSIYTEDVNTSKSLFITFNLFWALWLLHT